MDLSERLRLLKEKHRMIFNEGKDEVVIVKAPGRVNLIGEHTDYNDGYVLPVAIEKDILIAAKARDDRMVVLHSMDLNEEVRFSLDDIKKDPNYSWADYPKGVAFMLQEAGFKLYGMDAVIQGNIPQGAGLSSSAAFEVATAFAFQNLSGFDMDGVQMAKLCQRAENEFVGVNCGIMDQFISALGKKDHALFIDCRSLDYKLVPLYLEGVKIFIANTGVKRGLVSSEYNKRRAECEEGVKLLKNFIPHIKALRDVSSEELKRYENELPERILRRCEHVVTENERVLRSVEVLEVGDIETFGHLLNESHDSLRYKYEVSCSELDIMVEIARSVPGVLGSRMTGAGFGGCTVSLVKEEAIEELTSKIKNLYQKKTRLTPEIYVSSPEDGVIRI